MKELKSKNTEFHTYKSKQKRSFRGLLKHIHIIANLDDIKKEIENLGYAVISIWNIKEEGTNKKPFICFMSS
jgi:hypothetical protein